MEYQSSNHQIGIIRNNLWQHNLDLKKDLIVANNQFICHQGTIEGISRFKYRDDDPDSIRLIRLHKSARMHKQKMLMGVNSHTGT